MLEEDEQIAAQTEWIHYKYAAIDKLNEDVATAITLQQCESQKSSVETDEPHIPQVTNSSLFDLCMHLIRNKDGIGISNVCLLVIIMVCLSPSNAHVERMVKALNHIKTTERVRLVQVKLNNLFRVSTNSEKGANFNPQAVIDHWAKISIDAQRKGQPVILQNGQEVPNLFKLKSSYPQNRATATKTTLADTKIKVEPKTPTPSKNSCCDTTPQNGHNACQKSLLQLNTKFPTGSSFSVS